MLPLLTLRLELDGERVDRRPAGDAASVVLAHIASSAPGGLVLLGNFGAGKTSLCSRIASEQSGGRPSSFVPLAILGRSESVETGLERALGKVHLAEARAGDRVLLLDGLDEVPDVQGVGYQAMFRAIIDAVGPRWVLTSRPSHFRSTAAIDAEQADSLSEPTITTLIIEPLARDTVRELISDLPNGRNLLATVAGLEDLATSPLLLRIILAAMPYIEAGRPIDAWGLLDAWLRHALYSGPSHHEVLVHLEQLAWNAFRDSGWSTEAMSMSSDQLAAARIPPGLRRELFVTELDGRVRFGHRSVFEYMLATHIAPELAANQGHGADALSGLRITDATRAFLVGRLPRMPVVFHGERVQIPRGNFVAGGANNPDERPLRIQHLTSPFWIQRMPVTHADWSAFLAETPDERQDAGYLAHWSPNRQMPEGWGEVPIFGIWPEDADAYAASRGARLPTADEWEKAVRGVDGRRWPWGDHWRAGNAVTAEIALQRPLPARAFGAQGDAHLFSASGGVFEYTSSAWRDRPDRGRVVMGGCYTHPAAVSRPALRLSHKLSGHLKAGLRLAWDAS